MFRLTRELTLRSDTPNGSLERGYLADAVSIVSRLPGLRRRVLLRAVVGPDGEQPNCWRADDFWFCSWQDVRNAMRGDTWKCLAAPPFGDGSVDISIKLFAVEEDYRSQVAPAPEYTPVGSFVFPRATWRVRDSVSEQAADDYYREIHIPNVRTLPGLHRHPVLRSVTGPVGSAKGSWRAAENWWASRAEFDAMRMTHQWRDVQTDGYLSLVAEIAFDHYIVEHEEEHSV